MFTQIHKFIIINREEDIPSDAEIDALNKQGVGVCILVAPWNEKPKIDRGAKVYMAQLPLLSDEPEITIRFVDKPTNTRNERRMPL